MTDQSPVFLLVAGDLSGIQDFVYSISSLGALKGLRARSFFLELLVTHTVDLLIAGTGMSLANVLYTGGGNFALLLPYLASTQALIAQTKSQINAWLLQEFDARLYLGMVTVPITAYQLWGAQEGQPFGEIWQQAAEQLEGDKRQRFVEQLRTFTPQGTHSLLAPVEPRQRDALDACQMCHRDDVPADKMRRLFDESEGNRVCLNCYRFFHVGDRLATAQYIARRPGVPTPQSQSCLGLPGLGGVDTTYMVISSPDTPQSRWQAQLPQDTDCVWAVNSFHVPTYQEVHQIRPHARLCSLLMERSTVTYGDLKDRQSDLHYGATYRRAMRLEEENLLTLTNRPARNGDTVSFAGLAEAACGAKLIGALRMDIDHLGIIMSRGLHGRQRSVAHVSALSRQLSYFFKGYLNWICAGDRATTAFPEGEEEPALPLNVSRRLSQSISNETSQKPPKRLVSVIYAGGDDLFLVGAWSDVAEVTYDIAHCFQEYTCHQHKFVSISAGMTLHHPKIPVAHMAQRSLAALQRAKEPRAVLPDRWCCVRWSDCVLYFSKEGAGRCGERGNVALFYDEALEARARQLKERYTTKERQPAQYRERIVTTLGWEEALVQTVGVVQQLCQLGTIDDGALSLRLPRSFLQCLLVACRRWQDEGVLYIPFLEWAYTRVESALGGDLPPAEAQAWEWVKGTLLPKLTSLEPAEIKSAHVPLTWVELLVRRQTSAEG